MLMLCYLISCYVYNSIFLYLPNFESIGEFIYFSLIVTENEYVINEYTYIHSRSCLDVMMYVYEFVMNTSYEITIDKYRIKIVFPLFSGLFESVQALMQFDLDTRSSFFVLV
jgi:hypothetical protein